MLDFLFIVFSIVCGLVAGLLIDRPRSTEYTKSRRSRIRLWFSEPVLVKHTKQFDKKMTERVLEDFIYLRRFHHLRGIH